MVVGTRTATCLPLMTALKAARNTLVSMPMTLVRMMTLSRLTAAEAMPALFSLI